MEGVEDLLLDVNKYAKVGIWLCQGQTKAASTEVVIKSTAKTKQKRTRKESELSLDELLWVDLIDTIVKVTKDVTHVASSTDVPNEFESTISNITNSLRSAVQECFTALLNSTTRPSLPSNTISVPPMQPHPTFLIILRAFLTRASHSSPSLSDLRAVLADIFAAYTFEETILSLANRFLDKDAFTHVAVVHDLRQRGWRPRGQVCEGCKKRAWGPGAGGDIWDAWERRGEREEEARGRKRGGSEAKRREERGKGRASGSRGREGDEESTHEEDERGEVEGEDVNKDKKEDLGPLVVFACRHLWHKRCLMRATEDGKAEEGRGVKRRFKCPICA